MTTTLSPALPHALSRHTRTPGLSLADLAELVRTIAGAPELWQSRVRIPADGEDRWWTRLSGDRRVDVWLLSWLPDQATELHDHGASSAAFTVLSGQLAEVRADAGGRRTTYARKPGSVTWIAPGVVHDVRGSGAGPSVSIHAYSPPLRRMTYYETSGQGLRSVRSVLTDQPEEAAR